jgi:acetyl-CoA/propionyl-CoA carboxylase biotin carboxyl carrier protein
MRPMTIRAVAGDALHVVQVSGTLNSATVATNGGVEIVASLTERDGDALITIGGESRRAWSLIDGTTTWVCVGGETWPFVEEDVASRVGGAGALSDDVRSPMPGTVVNVRAQSGHEVRAGEALVVVSAMKMEHVLVAPHDGTVDILVRDGDSVVVDEVLARVHPINTSTEVSS